ncbi:hypothetical protein [Azospirillum sp. HJ39]|uniref:hypothetical protein n=1 Tax=Azospirillum sp. HJ39 TaxID=3159496 RepID=UPI0035570F11
MPEHAPFRDIEAAGAQPAAFVVFRAWADRFWQNGMDCSNAILSITAILREGAR